MKKLQNLRIRFVVLEAYNVNIDADYAYKLKGLKKKYEYVDEKVYY